MSEMLLILIVILIAWYWLDAISKREIAISLGRELAKRCQLQLLDETVACDKIWLARDHNGHARIARLYVFEVSANGQNRFNCQLQILGKQLQHWHIPPYIAAG